MKKYHQNIIWFALLFAALIGCDARREHFIEGRTMGTTYHITVVSGPFKDVNRLGEKIELRLDEINRVFSTYNKDSEISRFNTWSRVGEKFQVSDDFIQVMKVGRRIYRLSAGAWDGTVKPLVDLWGFGSIRHQAAMPPAGDIQALLPEIGFDHIEIREPHFLVKNLAAVTLDLNSIAKGFGVDEIARLIAAAGIKDYLVEIGGEIYAAGVRGDGRKWRVGINMPRADAAVDAVYKTLSISNQALATSGDYRNFFEINGVRYSHVIDPLTGYPVSNGVVSVSVITDNCTLADGLATALMVMGTSKGIELVNRLNNVECLMVVENSAGNLVNYYSNGFKVEN
jgi:thiamine biosynthesis lipoprotein